MEEKMNYDSCEKRLNEILTQLENEKKSIEETLLLFEEAGRLMKFASQSLEEIKGKVSIIAQEFDEILEKPFS